jgi:hypothetical protein
MPLLVRWKVLLFRIAEGPDFIALHALAGKITQSLVLVSLTGRPEHGHKALYGILGGSCHANGSANRVSVYQRRNYLSLFQCTDSIHIILPPCQFRS